jgi:phosphatidylinositol 4-kinase
LEFGLEKTPGGNIGFEAAPFKLTTEYVTVMGGESSDGFKKFR